MNITWGNSKNSQTSGILQLRQSSPHREILRTGLSETLNSSLLYSMVSIYKNLKEYVTQHTEIGAKVHLQWAACSSKAATICWMILSALSKHPLLRDSGVQVMAQAYRWRDWLREQRPKITALRDKQMWSETMELNCITSTSCRTCNCRCSLLWDQQASKIREQEMQMEEVLVGHLQKELQGRKAELRLSKIKIITRMMIVNGPRALQNKWLCLQSHCPTMEGITRQVAIIEHHLKCRHTKQSGETQRRTKILWVNSVWYKHLIHHQILMLRDQQKQGLSRESLPRLRK